MERCHIWDYTSMPSVYGDSRLKFDHAGDAISIEQSVDDFYLTITDDVNQKTRAGRAVIVVFETTRQLEAYSQSQYFKKVMQANVLHESLDSKKRDHVIRKAATSGQATFTSAVFGRGTDFFCHDSKLADAGGVHVLQDFFSRQKAEEVQIQGRTARQGKQGTYGLVLLQSDLSESFGLESDAFNNVARGTWYTMMDAARIKVQAAARTDIENDLAEATRVDALTHRYFDALIGLPANQSAKDCFLMLHEELRSEPSYGHGAGGYHIIFLTDVSGSMEHRDAKPGASFAAYGHNNRLGCALEACDSFIRTRAAARAADVITLIEFASYASAALTDEPLHENMITELLISGWEPGVRLDGGTNFASAFTSVPTAVREDLSGLPVLVMFLTDGGDDHSVELSNAISTLNQNENVSLKAIGFGSGADFKGLQRIAEDFGERGEQITAIDGVELVGSFQAVAAEISHTDKQGPS